MISTQYKCITLDIESKNNWSTEWAYDTPFTQFERHAHQIHVIDRQMKMHEKALAELKLTMGLSGEYVLHSFQLACKWNNNSKWHARQLDVGKVSILWNKWNGSIIHQPILNDIIFQLKWRRKLCWFDGKLLKS